MTEPQSLDRVLHVTSDYGKTSETFVVDAVQAAEDAGWEAWVAALRLHDRVGFPFPPNDRLFHVPPPLPRRILDRALRRNVFTRFADAVAPAAAQARPSVVHAHFGWAALWARPLAERLGLPLVCTFHASDVTVFPAPRQGATCVSPTYAEVFRRLDHAFVVSEHIASALRVLGWSGPAEILPAGVRLELFPLRTETPPLRPIQLLFVGRLVARKGLDVLLRALVELRRHEPDVRLDVIGDGPLRREYDELAVRMAPTGSVRFLGAQGRTGVRAALDRAHILVFPSRTMPSGEVEGSPVVVKEALAVGVPVVATGSGGTPEVIPPELRDELVPEDDPTALATRLAAVLQAPDSWEERARVGRHWVEEQFDWTILGRRTAATYTRLVSARPIR